MHFISTRSELLKAIAIAAKATSKLQRTVLECVLFECTKEGIYLKATDISPSIETRLKAEVFEEGNVALPARYLQDIISKFPESDVSFKSEDGNSLEITCMNSKIKLQCMSADEFPSFPDKNEGPLAKIQEGTLKRMLAETLFAVSDAEDKPILTGIHFEVNGSSLEMAALDGYRMAVRNENIIYEGTMDFVVPARAAREIAHISNDTEETVKFSEKKNMAMFEIGDTYIYTRLLEGEYVKYRNLIPGNQSIEILIERMMLRESVERAAVLARDRNNLIKFNISSNKLEITGESEIGNINEKMPIIQKGDDIEIAFNAKDVLEVLRALPDDEIKLTFLTSLSPCVATGTSTSGYLYLLLPLRI